MTRPASAPVVEAELHEYADGQIAPERRPAILAYLAGHPDAAARVEDWRRQNNLLRAHFAPIAQEAVPLALSLSATAATRFSAVPAFRPKVAADERREPPLPAPPPPASRPNAIAAFIFGLSVAFGIAGAGLMAAQMREGPPPAPPPRDFAARAFEAHRAFASEPAETMVRGAALQRWLQQKTGLAIPVADLAADGFVATGARLIPGESGTAALLLLDGPGGEHFSLTAAQAAGGAAGEAVYAESGGLAAANAAAGTLRIALVGKSPRAKMQQMAQAIAARIAASR